MNSPKRNNDLMVSTDHCDDVPFPNAEPEVDIHLVDSSWLITFNVNWIFSSMCFSLLALYNMFQLRQTFRLKKNKAGGRKYTAIVQILVIVLGWTRTLALSIYGHEFIESEMPARFPFIVPRLLYAIGYPCIFAGFTLVHKIFLQISNVKAVKRSSLKNGLIAAVIVVHFVSVIAIELITTYAKNAEVLLVICAFYYLIGCSGVAVSLFISGRRVVVKTKQIRENLNAFKSANSHDLASRRTTAKTEARTKKVYKITILTATSGLLCALSYIYTVVLIIRGVSGEKVVLEPWTWLVVTSFSWLFELCLAGTMSYAVLSTQHQRVGRRKRILMATTPSPTAFVQEPI